MMGRSAAKTPRNAAKIGDGIQPAQNAGWGLNSDFWPEYLPLESSSVFLQDLVRSEREARATSSTFRIKLTAMEKEFEQSKTELEDAKAKVSIFEKSNSSNSSAKDASHKKTLENDYKKVYHFGVL